MKLNSSLRTKVAQLLASGVSLLSFGGAMAATDKYMVSDLGGYINYPGAQTTWLQITHDAQGASGTFTSSAATGTVNTSELALKYKPFTFTMNGAVSFTPALITGDDIRQDFTSDASFLMNFVQAPPGLSDELLSGSIVGGSITGQVGSPYAQISLTVQNLSSGVIKLATDTTTLSFSAFLETRLSGGTYLDSLSLYSLNWSVPSSALAAAVPEPGTPLMFALGMAFMALSTRRATQMRRHAAALASH